MKHKSKYICETTIIFDLPKDIIKDCCTFKYYVNNTSIKPVVLGGGPEIILTNLFNEKALECTSHEFPFKIPNYLLPMVTDVTNGTITDRGFL